MARWLETEKADICERFVKGETATQIARRYQKSGRPEASRNAILGVLHRAGKLGQGRAKIASQPSSKLQALRSKPHKGGKALLAAPVVQADGVTYLAPVVIESTSTSGFGRSATGDRRAGGSIPIREVGETAVTLLQLDRGQCRFPVGSPGPGEDQLFCGRPGGHGSYCQAHAKAAFQPITAAQAASRLLRLARAGS